MRPSSLGVGQRILDPKNNNYVHLLELYCLVDLVDTRIKWSPGIWEEWEENLDALVYWEIHFESKNNFCFV